MRIRALETIRVPEHPNSVWLRIESEDGRFGLGETYYIPGAVEAVIHDFAREYLLGERVEDRERHWQTLFAHANFFGYAGAEMRAISAIDIALWDLLGQLCGLPICDLIGGRCREFVPLYNTCVNTPGQDDQDAFISRPGELARSLLQDGFQQMKVWPWDRFAPQRRAGGMGPAGWSAVGPPGHLLSAGDLELGLATVKGIREAVGGRMAIAIEGHARWDIPCALRIARALEPYDVVWMEDIIQPDSADDLARLVRETRIPQAVSERLITRHAFRPVLERQAAHVVMIDLIWTGGITEALKIASMADTYHLPIAPHDCTGPVNVLACLHLCTAAPNAMIMEVVRGFVSGYYREILDRPLPIQDGRAVVPATPGLGAALHPRFLARSDLSRRRSTAEALSRP